MTDIATVAKSSKDAIAIHSSTKKKMDSSEKSGGTTLKRKSSEQSSSSSRSKALRKNTLAIKVNGKTIKGSAQNTVGRVVEAERCASLRGEALKAQAVACLLYTSRGV